MLITSLKSSAEISAASSMRIGRIDCLILRGLRLCPVSDARGVLGDQAAARPSAGALAALEAADVVIIAPSNPVVSTDGKWMAFQVAKTADEAGEQGEGEQAFDCHRARP